MTSWSEDQLVAANEDAAEFFRRRLLGPDGDGPRTYLTQRGFGALLDDTPWTVGYAPAGWTALHDRLSELGYSDDCQLAAGLVTTSRRGSPIDRFRDRITFGICDADHALVGFVARSSPGASPQAPKYLNTPTTAIYNKRESLFGAGEQAKRLRTGATPVLVEGPLDAIAIAFTSLTEKQKYVGLALCGTACTDAHARTALVDKRADAILMFDMDPAGQRAMRTAHTRLSSYIEGISAARLATGCDPAEEFRRRGPSSILQHLARASDAADLLVDMQLESWPASQTGAEADLARLREVAALIADVSGPDMAHHAARLRDRLPFNDETIARELANAATRTRDLRPRRAPTYPAGRHHGPPADPVATSRVC